jgi:hypothetical protein
MKFQVTKTSDNNNILVKMGKLFIELNTLEEFIDWVENTGNEVVVIVDKEDNILELEIYDDWRE